MEFIKWLFLALIIINTAKTSKPLIFLLNLASSLEDHSN